MTIYSKERARQEKNKKRFSREGEVYALIYGRVSSDRQKKEGHGLESQEQRCRNYIKQKGYILQEGDIFLDSASGEGGYKSRPGQLKIMKRILDFPHRKYVVIVDDTSRIARDVQGHFEFRALLRECNVAIESPNFNFGETPEHEVFEGIMASVNQYHRKGNRRQVVQKMKARLERGYWTFGAKKGYTMVDHPEHGKLAVPSKEGIEMLKPAMEAFAAGTLVRKIDVCRFLVAKGFWKARVADRYIDKVTEILKDPFYAGDIAYPSWEVSRRKGRHEGIISTEVFDKIQLRLKKNNPGARIRTDITPEFPLRGLLVCAGCNRHVTSAWLKGSTKKYRYYYCQNKPCVRFYKTIPGEMPEKDFKVLLTHSNLKPEIVEVATLMFDRVWKEEIKSLNQKTKEQETEATKVQERMRELSDLVRQAASKGNVVLQKVYEDQLEDGARELSQLSLQTDSASDLGVPYQTALVKVTGLLKSPLKVWNSVDTLEKHRLFFFLFDAKLAYTKESGYQTAQILSTTRLFNEFAAQETSTCGDGRS